MKATRLDVVDMTETFDGTHVNEISFDKIEDSNDDTVGGGDAYIMSQHKSP